MTSRQAVGEGASATPGSGRAAQRRRTRAAIVDATTRLIAGGGRPSIDDIAAAADVSRRTVYLYFPTLAQLLLDATLGALSDSYAAPAGQQPDDAQTRIDQLVRSLVAGAAVTLPLGRRIIALTVDDPPDADDDPPRAGDDPPGADECPGAGGGPGAQPGSASPRRGYRRIGWITDALHPLREQLTGEQFSRLVSALSVVIGFEALVVLRDVAGLPADREEQVLRWTATSLIRAMLDEVAGGEDGGGGPGRPRSRSVR